MTPRSLLTLLLALCCCFAVLRAHPAGMRMDMGDMPVRFPPSTSPCNPQEGNP